MIGGEIERMVFRLAHSPDYGISNAEGNRIFNDLLLGDGKGLRGGGISFPSSKLIRFRKKHEIPLK
jgi:hypothetical protein